MSRRNVVDLDAERASRRDACLQFTLTVRDVASEPDNGRFLWSWETWDNLDEWRPSDAHFARQLRRIADRFDPQPVAPVTRRRRHRVRLA